MSTISSKIKDTIAKLTALQHAENRYNDTKTQLQKLNAEWKVLDKQLDKELEDIKALEKIGIKSLFHKVLGSQEEQLEKERQEYLTINLKYKELNKTIEITEFELGILEKKIVEKEAVEKELESLKEARLKEILRNNEPIKNDILLILKKEDEAFRLKEEINQALQAGKIALGSLKNVMTHLKNAEKWGNWDMYNKSGYYDHMKHGAIDRAVDEAYRSKQKLNFFREELNDVGFNHHFQLNVESFSKFTDIFFDNLISDWIIQRKIKNVISNVESTYDKVVNILKTLEKDLLTIEDSLGKLDTQKHTLLTN